MSDVKQDFLLTRRSFLLGGAAASSLLILPSAAWASKPKKILGVRTLAFDHLHTGEKAKITYWEHGKYIPDALAEVNHILRDHHNGKVHKIDRNLLNLLHALHKKVGSNQPFKVICGYRSPETNAMMHENSTGVAKHSMHIEGRAVDIALADRPLRDLRRAALGLRDGGVGYYPESQFVHVDTGPIRKW